MTLSLAYNDDLGRVQITASGLPDIGAVRVERSVNGLLWTTVRGASALTVEDGTVSVDDYEFVADRENHYQVVAPDDSSGLYLPGSAGAYASTPDTGQLDITNDAEVRVEADLVSWATGAPQSLVSKYVTGTNDRSYRLRVSSTGALQWQWSVNGTAAGNATATSTEVIPADAGRLAVRVWFDADNNAGGRSVRFYTADRIDADSWTQLGGTITSGGTSSIYAGDAPLEVGSVNDGAAEFATGVIYAAEVRPGLGSNKVCDVDFRGHATGTQEFTDASGLVWSVHGGALIVGGTIFEESITPSLGGRAWLKSIKHPFLNRPIHRALAGGGQDIGRAWRGGIHEVQGRSAPIAVTDIRSSREFTLTVQVPDEQAAAEMDLILASGDVFFIQVPPELAPHMSGGYVRIGATAQHRVADTIMWRFTLPCKVVAPPGPGVVGAPLTWGTVFNLYGSYEAMWAANPTWASLLSTVGSPDDLVVLP